MKKAISLFLILALCAACLCGCGSSSSSSSDSGTYEPNFEVIPPSFSPGKIDLTPVTISPGNYSFEVIPPTFETNFTIEMFDYESILHADPDMFTVKVIEFENGTLTVPEFTSSVSEAKIGSAYSDTYTVPDLSVDVPDYEHEEVQAVFVSMADNSSPEDQEKLAAMSEEEFASVAAVQMTLIDAFTQAFSDAGIGVPIDPLSGAIPIDSSVLFATDSYELTEAGKEGLKLVFGTYYSVVSDPRYRGLISAVVIEGHTDTDGDHAYNQTLSEKRAQAVRDFLLSDECGLEDTVFLRSILTTVGRSYDKPVYAADGSVDMAASRRVEIRFNLNLED